MRNIIEFRNILLKIKRNKSTNQLNYWDEFQFFDKTFYFSQITSLIYNVLTKNMICYVKLVHVLT